MITKFVVGKKYLGGRILYRSADPLIKNVVKDKAGFSKHKIVPGSDILLKRFILNSLQMYAIPP